MALDSEMNASQLLQVVVELMLPYLTRGINPKVESTLTKL